MRLTSIEQQALHDASLRWLGVPPRLFGSQVDDVRRDGDIDLYIEAQPDLSPQEAFQRETQMAAELYRVPGERKIDIIPNTGRLDLPACPRAGGLVVSLPLNVAQVAVRQLTAWLHPIEKRTNA